MPRHCTFVSLLLLLIMPAAESQPQSLDLVEATIADLQQAILNRTITCREIVEGYIRRIEAYDQASGLNAITAINPRALDYAAAIDSSIDSGQAQPDLFCAPLLIKDNFDTFDMVTSGGSVALAGSIPADDAFMISRLRQAGAIVLAKTNMAEWAFSPRETVSSSHGRTANAYDLTRVPAGSSGGTASGVAASFGVAGMGSDTGNSIRGPSAHLALFGIRSTLGLTSRDGVIPLSFDRDIAGPMARTVEDGVRLFNVVAGYDVSDPLSLPGRREPDYRLFLRASGLQGKRLGVFRTLVDQEDADPEIRQLFVDALVDLEEAGATIVDPFIIDNFVQLSEAIPSCGRFRHDVGQYLRTLPLPPTLDVNELLARGEFAEESRSAFEFYARFPLDTPPDEWQPPCPTWPDHPERHRLLESTLEAMNTAGIDALIFPTWSNPPAPIDRARQEYRGDNSQQLAPDAGLPSLTVPMGFWQNRLPAGLQFVGRPFAEGILIEMAYAYEQRTQHRRRPPGFDALP